MTDALRSAVKHLWQKAYRETLTPAEVEQWLRYMMDCQTNAQADLRRARDHEVSCRLNHNGALREAWLSEERIGPEKGQAAAYNNILRAWVERQCADTEQQLLFAEAARQAAWDWLNTLSNIASEIQTLNANMRDERTGQRWNR